MLNKKALAASVSAPPAVFVEDVFSTYLYSGTGASQTITNGIDLSGKGGLTWIKGRSGTTGHRLTDTVRGATKSLESNSTAAEATESTGLTAFGSTGFTIGADADYNTNAATYCSWTFRKQPKFFDIVTYTGTGVARNINHNLGSVPGMIIVKLLNTASDWIVYHRSSPNTDYLYLNEPNSTAEVPDYWNDTTPNSSTFRVNTNSAINGEGQPYVAYLFAHNDGGFGTAGTDNIISCGSFTTSSGTSYSSFSVNLGYEPQYVMIKRKDDTSNWAIMDIARNNPDYAFNDYALTSNIPADILRPNTAQTESFASYNAPYLYIGPTPTGFGGGISSTPSATFIYMAIRRPMKVPTDATKVFNATAGNGTGASNYELTGVGFSPDLTILSTDLTAGGYSHLFHDRLRGGSYYLDPTATTAQTTATQYGTQIFNQDGIKFGSSDGSAWNSNTPVSRFFFKRAPKFFDQVCYAGTGVQRDLTHNLSIAPELIIVKAINTALYNWEVWSVYTTVTAPYGHDTLKLNLTNAAGATGYFPTDPTSSVFTVSNNNQVNNSSYRYVAYLFATCPGVSKVGSYTGNGSSQTINCGFTAGARLVMIKRTDSTGDWYVYDTARGIVSGNDPQFKLNTTDAQATGYDAIDPDNSGFIVNNDATNFPINVNSATYIFLAIA